MNIPSVHLSYYQSNAINAATEAIAKGQDRIPSRSIRTCCVMRADTSLPSEGQDTRAIQQYLGHRNITHTVRYTELSPGRFKNFWRNLVVRI